MEKREDKVTDKFVRNIVERLAARSVHPSAIGDGATAGQVLTLGTDLIAEWVSPTSGVTDHGLLTGLADDDHPQYHNDSRGDARYWPLSTDLATQVELDAHINDTTDAHDASAISIVDAGGYYTSTDVEGALQEAATTGGASDLDDLSDVTIGTPATGEVIRYNGAQWVDATLVPGDVSGFDTQVRTSRLNQMTVPNAAVPMGTNKLTGLAAGSANGDSLRYEQLFTTGTVSLLGKLSMPDTLNLESSGRQSILAGGNLYLYAATGDTYAASRLGQAFLELGAGGGTPADWSMSRTAANEATIAAGDVLKLDTRPAGSNDTTAATTAFVQSAISGVGMAAPLGTINAFAGSTAPTGWLLCFGQAISRTTYADLFAVIGTTYGVGDGSTTFNLPDLRGRVVAGLDNMGGSDAGRLSWANTLGTAGGSQTHTLTAAEIPDHAHNLYAGSSGGPSGTGDGPLRSSAGFDSGFRTMKEIFVSMAYGSAQTGNGAHNNMQPTSLLNYVIKALRVEDSPAWGNAGALAYNSATQSVAGGGVATLLTWNSEEFDIDGMHSTSSNTDRLTCVTPGTYIVVGQARFETTSSAGYVGLNIYKNGSAIASHVPDVGENTLEWPVVQIATVVQMVAGDYISLYAVNDTGGAVNASLGRGFSHFSAVRVGYQTNPSGTLAYTAPTFTGTWTNYGSWQAAGYTKSQDGMVSLAGLIKRTGTSGGPIFTLPVGYRPASALLFVLRGQLTAGTYTDIRVDIGTAGVVEMITSHGAAVEYISLNQIPPFIGA